MQETYTTTAKLSIIKERKKREERRQEGARKKEDQQRYVTGAAMKVKVVKLCRAVNIGAVSEKKRA